MRLAQRGIFFALNRASPSSPDGTHGGQSDPSYLRTASTFLVAFPFQLEHGLHPCPTTLATCWRYTRCDPHPESSELTPRPRRRPPHSDSGQVSNKLYQLGAVASTAGPPPPHQSGSTHRASTPGPPSSASLALSGSLQPITCSDSPARRHSQRRSHTRRTGGRRHRRLPSYVFRLGHSVTHRGPSVAPPVAKKESYSSSHRPPCPCRSLRVKMSYLRPAYPSVWRPRDAPLQISAFPTDSVSMPFERSPQDRSVAPLLRIQRD